MNSIPNPEECIELLKKSGCSEEVISHCKAVREVAVRMAERANADVKLVEAGALLHDIGRSKTHGIRHLVEGARIAKNLGLPDSILKIIERHIGAGLPAEDARKLGLPEKNYIPETLEEKIVCHSDNLIDDGEKQTIESEVEKVLARGLEDYAGRLVALHKELSDICGVDVNNI